MDGEQPWYVHLLGKFSHATTSASPETSTTPGADPNVATAPEQLAAAQDSHCRSCVHGRPSAAPAPWKVRPSAGFLASRVSSPHALCLSVFLAPLNTNQAQLLTSQARLCKINN